jgi:hypothetical protein
LIGHTDLLVELVDAASDDAQRRLGGIDPVGQGGLLGRNRAQAAANAAVERPSSASRSDAGAVTSRPLSWLIAAVRASGGTAARRPERPDRLDDGCHVA